MLKTVLITGASKGIGKAILSRIRQCGYNVLSPSSLELNVSDSNSIDNYFKSLIQNIDILINNAGINIIADIGSINSNNISNMLETNLAGPLRLISKVAPYMKEKRCGKIVNISSIWGIRSKEYRTLYSMTKFGLNGITKSLARELGEYNILVNSIAPGYVNSEMTQKNISIVEQKKIMLDIPLRRFAEPEEIAKLVSFMISEDNTYITGQVVIIDGGFLA